MNISVFGLGYVGCVSIGCISSFGHRVIGVDVKNDKVDQINLGKATVFEPGLDALIQKGHNDGLITATSDVYFAVSQSSILLITVGTPSSKTGGLDLSYIYRVAENIGEAMKTISHPLTIAIRSTVSPGTCEKVKNIIWEKSGKVPSKDFFVVSNPEFLREGSAINDYMNPPYVLIGTDPKERGSALADLYKDLNCEIIEVEINTAEVIKYVNNSWHALKVVFGNEVGAVCKSLGIDSQEVMSLFIKDRILNISPGYLRPGFAYGGSCLPKDLGGFLSLARANNVEIPLLESVHASNDKHIERALKLIKDHNVKNISIAGLTFKESTDDIRNSPAIEIVKRLTAEGYNLKIYDQDVSEALKSGRNADLIKNDLGNLVELIVDDFKSLLDHSNVLVISKNDSFVKGQLKSINTTLIDLVYMGEEIRKKDNYSGLAW